MANKKKKVIEEVEVIETPIIEEPVEETVEEEIIAEEAKEDIIESDEGNIEDSVIEGEPEKIDEDVIVEDEPEIIPIVKVPTEDNTVVPQVASTEKPYNQHLLALLRRVAEIVAVLAWLEYSADKQLYIILFCLHCQQ